MNTKKATILILAITFTCVIVYLILDYNNVFTAIGYDFNRFNVQLMGIVINALLAVVLYAIAYNFVDKQNEKRQRNKRKVLKLMLAEVYESCLNNIRVIESYSSDQKAVYVNNQNEPIDFAQWEEIIKTLEKEPFENEHIIIDFFKDGSLPEKEYKAFAETKKSYMYYTLLKSEKLDGMTDSSEDVKADLEKKIKEAKQSLDLD